MAMNESIVSFLQNLGCRPRDRVSQEEGALAAAGLDAALVWSRSAGTYGPVWQRYWLDPGRTVVVGSRPSGAQRRIITAANEVVTRLIDEIRPGLPVRDLARRGRELCDATGTVEDSTSGTFPILGNSHDLF